jgi:hypothetical protein
LEQALDQRKIMSTLTQNNTTFNLSGLSEFFSGAMCTNGGKCMDGFWDFGLMDSQFSEIDIFAAVS